eukprot:6947759-Prymnesium_polylepis.1
MVSLGSEAYCTKLVASSIECTGSIVASHKVFGADSKNLGQAHFIGSMLYFQNHQIHQIDLVATVLNTSEVTITTTAAHGLVVGDEIHMSEVPANPTVFTDVNGMVLSHFTGSHAVTHVDSTTVFRFSAGGNATTTGVAVNVLPLIRIDRYVSTDLAIASDQPVAWTRGTSVPIPSHTNTELFFS